MKNNLLSQQASIVMMVRPAFFGFNPETAASNAFQQERKGAIADSLHEQALREFDLVREKLVVAGINVHVFQNADVDTPDAIFPNNWFSTHHDGTLVLYPMLALNRRRERSSGLEQYLEGAFKINRKLDLTSWEEQSKFLEGTGSIVFDHACKMAYAVSSPRTNLEVLHALCIELNYDYHSFHCNDAIGNPVYHTNVVMHIGENYIMYCEEGIPSEEERSRLKISFSDSGRTLLTLSLAQMNSFCGNMLQIKNRDGRLFTVCSRTAYDSLEEKQLEQMQEHTEFLIVDIPVIENVGGGGVRCMLAEIFLEPKIVAH
ncbi:MAG: amidinotransferase [Bacteroidetes bacterium]|nr:amidinotransferase [Bacteroidota bacterium]